jgi:hypothetical protein
MSQLDHPLPPRFAGQRESGHGVGGCPRAAFVKEARTAENASTWPLSVA